MYLSESGMMIWGACELPLKQIYLNNWSKIWGVKLIHILKLQSFGSLMKNHVWPPSLFHAISVRNFTLMISTASVSADSNCDSISWHNFFVKLLVNMSLVRGWKWKWSNGVGKGEMDLFWCTSMTNNAKTFRGAPMRKYCCS